MIKNLTISFAIILSFSFSNQGKRIPISISNDSVLRDNIRTNRSWDWNIWITPLRREDLKKIKYVKYTLHESFADPDHVVFLDSEEFSCFGRKSSPNQYFKLCCNGWGEFTVKVQVVYTNGYSYDYDYDICLFKCAKTKVPNIKTFK